MTSAIYFGAFTDMKFINVENLKDIRHFILVDQLPERVKYFEPDQCGYDTCFNELVFVSELYHQLRIQNVEIIDMIQRPNFVKFIIMRDEDQITVDYYYNTTVEDAITVSELGDVMKHVDTLILCGFDPFDPFDRWDKQKLIHKYNLTYEHIPYIKKVWITCDEKYEKHSIYMPMVQFKKIVEDYDWYDYWYEIYGDTSDEEDEEDEELEGENDKVKEDYLPEKSAITA